MRGLRAAVALGAFSVLAASCGASQNASTGDPPPPNTAAIVEIRNVAFNPKSATIHAGQTVAWHFDDGTIVHNVIGSGWRSPDRTTGYYTHAFTAPGTYAYRCTIHSDMDGQVIVSG